MRLLKKKLLVSVTMIMLFGLPLLALADNNYDRRVIITNESSFEVKEFYASRVSTDDWEENIVEDKPLKSGDSGRFDFNDGSGACLFDFKIVFEDGDVGTASSINVCKITNYYIRD